MTAGVNPQLAQRLAETQANIQARSAQISDHVRARSKEIAEEAQRLRAANEALCEELDKRVADRIAANDDPNAKAAWVRPSESRDTSYAIGELADETEEPAQSVGASASPLSPLLSASQPPPNKGKHAKREDGFDDDDFSSTNWLD